MFSSYLLFILVFWVLAFSKRSLLYPPNIISLITVLLYLFKYSWNKTLGVSFILGINEYHIDLGFKFFTLVLGCSFLINYFWSKNSGEYVLKKYFQKKELNLKNFALVCSRFNILLLCLSILIIWAKYNSLNINLLTVRGLYQSNGMAYFLIVLLLSINLNFIICGLFISKQQRPPLNIIIACLLSFLLSLLSGWASTILICVGNLLLPYIFTRKLKLYVTLAVIFPVVALYGKVHNDYRIEQSYNPYLRFSEFQSEARIKYSEEFKYVLNRFDYLEMFSSCFANPKIYDRYDYKHSLNILLQFIPRRFWADKPFNNSTELSRIVIPDVVAIAGSTANFNAFSEFIFSFGIFLGAIASIIILTFILRIGILLYHRAQADNLFLLYYIGLIFPYISNGFLAGYINDFALPNLIIGSIVFVVLYKMSLNNEKYNSRKR